MLFGHLALVAAAVFSGAALYVSFVEHPARLVLDDAPLLTQWKPAYARGTLMQAPLAVAGFLLGIAAWWQTGRLGFLAGALLMIANWPWTLLVIMPVNKRLTATDPARVDAETRSLILKWGQLHGVRTALGAAATAAFLWAML